jgi:hypothetical protein
MMRTELAVLATCALMLIDPWSSASAQDSKASEIIERDPDLFRDISLDQFLVVAPGGRIETKDEAIRGVTGWEAESIEVRDEQVIFHGNTAVLVGRLKIDGVMRPVGTLPPMKFMAVFVDSSDGWKLLARSLTPCFPIAIERGFC